MKIYNKEQKPKSSLKGMYIALIIGAIVIAGAGIFGIASMIAANNAPNPDDYAGVEDTTPGEDYDSIFDDNGTGEDQVMNPGVGDTTKDNVPAAAVQTPTKTPTPTPVKTAVYFKPVSGNIIKAHSPEDLVYSATFKDWRIHNGVDIEAAAGAKVIALTDGTVEDVYKDDMLGSCVVIKHANGLKSFYANLMDNVPVKKGQTVKAGDTIGGVGNSAWTEVAEKSHLHFEVTKDGKQQDPETYFKKSK